MLRSSSTTAKVTKSFNGLKLQPLASAPKPADSSQQSASHLSLSTASSMELPEEKLKSNQLPPLLPQAPLFPQPPLLPLPPQPESPLPAARQWEITTDAPKLSSMVPQLNLDELATIELPSVDAIKLKRQETQVKVLAINTHTGFGSIVDMTNSGIKINTPFVMGAHLQACRAQNEAKKERPATAMRFMQGENSPSQTFSLSMGSDGSDVEAIDLNDPSALTL